VKRRGKLSVAIYRIFSQSNCQNFYENIAGVFLSFCTSSVQANSNNNSTVNIKRRVIKFAERWLWLTRSTTCWLLSLTAY